MTPLKDWGEGDKKLNGFAKGFLEALSTLGLMTETWRQCVSAVEERQYGVPSILPKEPFLPFLVCVLQPRKGR